MPNTPSLLSAIALLAAGGVCLDRESTVITDPVLWGVKNGLMPCVFGPSERAQAAVIAAIPLPPRPAIVRRDQKPASPQ
jgi:hypothetical protein